MFCDNCGNVVADTAVVCDRCGKPLKKSYNTNAHIIPAEELRNQPVYEYVPVQEQVKAEETYSQCMDSNIKLKTNYAWWKLLFLSIVTLFIYPAIMCEQRAQDLNIAASRYDGKRTKSPLLKAFLMPFTLGIYHFVYEHKYASRLGTELNRRGIKYNLCPGHYWLLCVLLGFTVVCPIIYSHKLCKATNHINKHFNEHGV